jgi:hypothetical protein
MGAGGRAHREDRRDAGDVELKARGPGTGAGAFFALDPLNLALPLVGAVVDLVLLPPALSALTSLLPRHLREPARAAGR